MVEFEWDSHKAAATLRKHRVPFEEAASAFEDKFGTVVYDEDHSGSEDRYRLTAQSIGGRLLVITCRYSDETIRIINARKATKQEIKRYEEAHA